MTDLQTRLQEVLGPSYRIERELGGGGMSRVFLAEEVDLARKVVVKVLPPDMAAGLNAERFKREIQLAASLQHPHIVPLIASGRSGDVVWYTMPFIEGESLRAKLARERELPIGEAVRILRDVADALSYAHDHGVVHRDIKPDNVLITGRHAVVTDFGVAKAVSASTGESSLTSIGVALGTPAYMAPEQASADPNVDHRADIYSLGAMAYEMLSGQPPFAGPPQLVLAAHVTQAPEPVTQRRASVPPALATLIMRALEKKAADRWQTASELHQQFELMATPSGGAPPTSAMTALTAQPSSRRALFIGGGLVVVAALVMAGLRLARPSSSVDEVVLDPRVVAVLPFRVAGADPSLHYLRQGMLDLLQAKLTGEGGPRAADARSVLAAFRDAGGTDQIDVADAGVETIARRLGAGRILQGSIVGPPDHVVLNASLLEVPGGRSVAQASVEGPNDSLFTMIDRLVAQVLALGAGATSQQLSALTTTNLEALRAYLDGVTAYRRGAFDQATTFLTRAVEHDSTFALATSALVEAHGWSTGTMPIARVRRLAWQYRDRLGAKDQQVLTLRLGSRYPDPTSYAERLADRERAVQDMPENAQAWYYLGDWLFHYGRLADVRDHTDRARVAFERAFRLDSLYGGPVAHLTSITGAARDTAVRRWRRLAASLDSTNVSTRFSLDWAMASGLGDTGALGSLLAVVDTAFNEGVQLLTLYPGDSAVVVNRDRILDALLRNAPSARRQEAMTSRVVALWNAGRPAEARHWIDSLEKAGAPFTRGLRGATAAFTGDTTDLDRVLRPAPMTPSDHVIVETARLRLGDARSTARNLVSIRAGISKEPVLARMGAVIEAWAARVSGAPAATVERLTSVADSAVRGWGENIEGQALILSDLWESLGKPERALTAVRRREWPLGNPTAVGLAVMLRREGRLAAATGDREGAIRAYEQYLLLRRDPEPLLTAQRDSVVAELAALKR